MALRTGAVLPDRAKADEETPAAGAGWSVYIIRCDDGTLYTGVSTDVQRRFRQHLERSRGAKYFNGRKPLEVAWCEGGHSRSSACRREAAIKRLSRDAKLELVGRP